jgi:hypothetical protein
LPVHACMPRLPGGESCVDSDRSGRLRGYRHRPGSSWLGCAAACRGGDKDGVINPVNRTVWPRLQQDRGKPGLGIQCFRPPLRDNARRQGAPSRCFSMTVSSVEPVFRRGTTKSLPRLVCECRECRSWTGLLRGDEKLGCSAPRPELAALRLVRLAREPLVVHPASDRNHSQLVLMTLSDFLTECVCPPRAVGLTY